MNRRIALAAAPLVLLAACSSGGGSSEPSSSSSTASSSSPSSASSATTSSAATTPPADPDADLSTSAAPAIALHAQGKAGNQGMTIESVTPMQSVPYGARDADLNSVPAKASAGMQYVEVKATFENVGAEPVMPEGFGQMVTADGKRYAEDDDVSGTVSADAPDQPASKYLSSEVNPGAKTPFLAYFLIPKDAKPVTLEWADAGALGTFKLN